MNSWGKKIAVCVLLVASFVVFLQAPANAYSVYLSSYESGLGSTGRIYGNEVGPYASLPFVFCIEGGVTVNVPGTYYATNTALTGKELNAAWLMKKYGNTTNVESSYLKTGIVLQNAIWGVTGQAMHVTGDYLAIANDWIAEANGADLSGIASSYVRMNLFTDSSLLPKYGVQDQIRSVVPIPGALWLLGSGLAGLVGIRRRFTKQSV